MSQLANEKNRQIDILTHCLIDTLNKYISHDNISRKVQKQFNSFKVI
jgi:hypothetical protein